MLVYAKGEKKDKYNKYDDDHGSDHGNRLDGILEGRPTPITGLATKTLNNNGHGNNIDGVDMSNPGNSKQGEDTDPTVDDEI